MNNELFLLTYRIDKIGDDLIYMAEDAGYLMKVSLSTGDTDIVFKPSKPGYRAFVMYGDEIVMFPDSRGYVCFYNIRTGTERYEAIPDQLHMPTETNWSAYYIRHEDTLYFFWQSAVITTYDLKNSKWDTYREWIEQVEKMGVVFEGFSKGGYINDNKAYFHIARTNYFVVIDLKTGKNDVIEIDYNGLRLSDDEVIHQICELQGSIIVQTVSGKKVAVYEADCYGRIKKRLTVIDFDTICFKRPFNVIFALNNKVYLLPGDAYAAYCIDANSGYCEQVKDIVVADRETKIKGKNRFDFNYGIIIDDIWYGFNVKTSKLILIDGKTCKIQSLNVYGDEQKVKMKNKLFLHGPCAESETFDLGIYLKMI